jgi:VanZ family protein
VVDHDEGLAHAMRPTSLAAIIVLLIAYGSLYPFDFRAPLDAGLAFEAFLSDRSLWTSRGDVLGNIGLFIPLGLSGVWSVVGTRARLRAAGATFAGGLAVAFGLQVAQLWIASRSAVLSDVAWNGVGILLGIAAGLVLAVPPVARRLPLGSAQAGALGLLCAWVIAELAPLVPSLDLGAVKASARQLLVTPSLNPVAAISMTADVLLASRLLFAITGPRHSGLALAALAAAMLGGKVLVVEMRLGWTAVAGVGVGLLVWFLWSGGGRRAIPSRALLAVVLGAYALRALDPFVFGAASTFSWTPFAASLKGSMLSNLKALAAAVFSLGGCLWLVRDIGWRPLPASCGLALWALTLEIAQIWVEGRTASVTDPVLVLLGGWLLWRADRGATRLGDGPE